MARAAIDALVERFHLHLQAQFGIFRRGFEAGLDLRGHREFPQGLLTVARVLAAALELRSGRLDRMARRLGSADLQIPGLELLKISERRLVLGDAQHFAVVSGQILEAAQRRSAVAFGQFQVMEFSPQPVHQRWIGWLAGRCLQRLLKRPADVFGSGYGFIHLLFGLLAMGVPGAEDSVAMPAKLPPELLVGAARGDAHGSPALLQTLDFGHLRRHVRIRHHQRLGSRHDFTLAGEVAFPSLLHFGVNPFLGSLEAGLDGLAFLSVNRVQGTPFLARRAHDLLSRLHVRTGPIDIGEVGLELRTDALAPG